MRVGGLVRRPEAALFALALGTYAYFFQGGGWNQNARFNLVRAVVEQHSIVVDDYIRNTGDVAIRDGHYYSDKAPGVAALALPVYAAVHPFAGGARPRGRLVNAGAYLATVWACGLPTAIVVALLYRLGTRLGAGPPASAAVAAAYALGTLAFPYATLFYSHQPAAAALFGAFTLVALSHLRSTSTSSSSSTSPSGPAVLFPAGILLGAAPTFEYPSALAAAAIFIYCATTLRPRVRLAWVVAGAALPLAALAAYHAAAWGSPFLLPGHFSVDPRRHAGAFMGISTPSAGLVTLILLSPTRGLFRHAPWLVLWIPGVIALARRPAVRAEAAACALVPALYIAFNSTLTTSPVDWHAGWGIGPRHVVAALPFCALAVAGLFAGTAGMARRAAAVAFALLAAASAALMLIATAVRPEVPTWYDRPFGDYLWPLFASGALGVNTLPIHTGFVNEQRQAWNLGEVFGLHGLASLLPLLAWVAATGAWLLATLRAQRAGATS